MGLKPLLAKIAAVLAIAAFGTVIASPANADTPNIEIANGGNTNLRVDVMWASTNPLQGAFLWPNNSSLSQEFDLLDSGGGFYRIRARHSGQCLMLDWRAGTYSNGTRILQYPACGAGYTPAEWSTQWIWRSNGCTGNCFTTGTWYARIRNRATGRCLDAANGAGGVPGTQAVLQQWDCIGSATQWNAWNQMWSFVTATSVPSPPLH